jgi:hypothetical protein
MYSGVCSRSGEWPVMYVFHRQMHVVHFPKYVSMFQKGEEEFFMIMCLFVFFLHANEYVHIQES